MNTSQTIIVGHDYVPMHSHIPHPEHCQVVPTFVSQGRRLRAGYWLRHEMGAVNQTFQGSFLSP